MSCKILTIAQRAGATPLFERQHEPAPADDAAPPARDEPHPQVEELHSRIVELERALQRDVEHARRAGFRDGETSGREKGTAEVQPVLERLTRSLADVAGLKNRLRREAEQDLVELSISIARRIIRRELTVDPEAIGGLVRAALDKLHVRDVCRVRVHPDHQLSVRTQLEKQGAGSAEVVGDPALQRGDVVVESRRGDLDASVESQLSEIERGFADRLRRCDP
jgi:flagellar assembly protein FliH